MTDKKPKVPGRGRHGNQGRKKSTRELKSFSFSVFKDQLPISSDKVRKAIDLFNKMLKDNKNTTDEG